MNNFEQIKIKLNILKKYDPTLKVFGSSWHKYESNPKLKESEIEEFEENEGVKLPQGYRDFLKNIGDGGAGPSYGLYSLNEARNGASFYPPIQDLNNKTDDEKESPGELLITQNGCGHFTWLKITDQKEEIWHDGRVGGAEPCIVSTDFLGWYNNWLDFLFIVEGFISNLGYEAITLGQKGDYKKALDFFKVAVDIEIGEDFSMREDVKVEYLKIFCNVLYFLQKDNTGLAVDIDLNNYFLNKCMPHGKENPEIFFNAACVYNEMKDYDNVIKCIEQAKEHYSGYSMMAQVIKTEPVFTAFIEKHGDIL